MGLAVLLRFFVYSWTWYWYASTCGYLFFSFMMLQLPRVQILVSDTLEFVRAGKLQMRGKR